MLRSKSTSSRARAATTSSRASSSSSRGRGRGASSSSSEFFSLADSDHGPRQELRGSRTRTVYSRRSFPTSYRNRNHGSNHTHLGTPLDVSSPNPFETERLENAAKREQRGQESAGIIARGARGSTRGRYQNKSVRFASPPIQPPKEATTTGFFPPIVANGTQSPFASTNSNTSGNGAAPPRTPFNPFAPISTTDGVAPQRSTANGTGWNPFSSTLPVKIPPTNPFGVPQNINGAQQSSTFSAPSAVKPNSLAPNPFSTSTKSSSGTTSIFGTSTPPSFSSNNAAFNPFSANKQSMPVNGSSFSPAGTNHHQGRHEGNSQSPFSQAGTRTPFSAASSPFNSPKNKLATEIDNLLRKNGIVAPSWPTPSPGDPTQKVAVESFWQNTKAYRAKVRTCLIRNGYLDDPDKPKKLSEAIDFKGTCEEMCPEFEKVTRIIEHDVQNAEKELSPDGQTYWPALRKMVKALARSAAGQDAPLPEDVRSPAALRRTLDYLIDTILGTNDLPTVHGFLWDRTRAIRRDFVFQQSSMTSPELLDQVYCLELITRFHVVALHQMSHQDVIAEDFSEQQEVEQLGKALLSLIHAYEDCMAQGIQCENESEFRAYYVLFNSHNPGILEAVQDWGWKYWGESDDIRTAVRLVETLQNIWDTQGPLKPHSTTDIAQNAYHRFFLMVEDMKVSYTMACFAEIHFNKVRKAALKTILASYRKQRDQTTDWTLERLNAFLHFDEESDVMTFGEAYGVHFEFFNGQECLSFESDDQMQEPLTRLKQPHSRELVERKRGSHTLPHVIHHTVYGESAEGMIDEDDSNSLFVKDPFPSEQPSRFRPFVTDAIPDPLENALIDNAPFSDQPASKPIIQKDQAERQVPESHSLFQTRAASSSNLKNVAPATNSRADDDDAAGGKALGDSKTKPIGATTSIFENKPVLPAQGIFSFLDQKKSSGPSQPSSSTPSIFPQSATSQVTKTSEQSITLDPRPLFSSLKAGGTLLTTPLTTPSLMPTTNSGSAADAVKETISKDIDSRDVITNHQEPKHQSVDRLIGGQQTSLKSQPPVITKDKKSRMETFTNWVALGHGGVVNQFTEAVVEKILIQTVNDYVANEKSRLLKEEEQRSRKEAADFRFKFLAAKYFYAWRDIAHRLWMKRKGRSARQARRQLAEESFHASRAAGNRDVVDDFRASRGAKERDVTRTSDSIKNTSPPRNGTGLALRGTKRGNHLSNGESERSSKQRQNLPPDNVFRKSLLSDSAYLQGGSRTHLLPNYMPTMESGRHPNGVKTDYFRLKARGIMTLPDGTPLANTAAVHLSHKRSLDNVRKSLTPEKPIRRPHANSVPSKPMTRDDVPPTSEGRYDDLEALKERARMVMAKDKEGKQRNKRFLDEDEAELFASAKRVRDQMDEETLWMKSEIQKCN